MISTVNSKGKNEIKDFLRPTKTNMKQLYFIVKKGSKVFGIFNFFSTFTVLLRYFFVNNASKSKA